MIQTKYKHNEKTQARKITIKILGTIIFFSHHVERINRERNFTAVKNNKIIIIQINKNSSFID